MAITTPALHGMERFLLLPQAYQYADASLVAEGLDPLQAFDDAELRRHHYAIASGFQHDVARLETLGALAFTDRNFGSDMLQIASATPEEREIARDFDSKQNRLHCNIPSVCKYVLELRMLGGEQ